MNNEAPASSTPPISTDSSAEPFTSSSNDVQMQDYVRWGTDCREDPIAFLQQRQNLKRLPPQTLSSSLTTATPKQRTVIAAIRNRRLSYVNSQPPELEFENARDTWPHLWGQDRGSKLAERENRDERAWTDAHFLDGRQQHVGKLGTLLGDYAEEREAERLRTSRRKVVEEFVPEEEDSEDSEDVDDGVNSNVPDDSPDEVRADFERLVRERFIYGLLDGANYDAVDWDDRWDLDNDRFDEERWFDDEEAS